MYGHTNPKPVNHILYKSATMPGVHSQDKKPRK